MSEQLLILFPAYADLDQLNTRSYQLTQILKYVWENLVQT